MNPGGRGCSELAEMVPLHSSLGDKETLSQKRKKRNEIMAFAGHGGAGSRYPQETKAEQKTKHRMFAKWKVNSENTWTHWQGGRGWAGNSIHWTCEVGGGRASGRISHGCWA